MGRVAQSPPRWEWVWFCLVAAIGCGDRADSGAPATATDEIDESPPSGALVAHERWQLVEPSQDPYWLGNDARIACEPLDIELTHDSVEVNTRYCNHATLTQPSLRAVEPGETIHHELWWQPLASETPAVARLRLRVGALSLLEEDVPIPQDAGIRSHQSNVTTKLPAGTPIYFHVSNHGINSYTLHALEALPPDGTSRLGGKIDADGRTN